MKYDIIIVGGGMAGCAVACALAQRTSLSIAILESRPSTQCWSLAEYHHRVSAISLSSQRIFQSLGVWDAMRAKRVSPFTKIQVWDAEGSGGISFDSREIDEAVLGCIIENNVILSALEEKVRQSSQIEFIAPVKLTAFMEYDDRIEIGTDDEKIFTAKLAVAADGAQSWLRERAGIDANKHDYKQQAIVTTVKTELPHEQTARQVFLPSGPLAFLPLQDAHTSSIVWSLPESEAQRLKECDMDEFKRELAAAFSHKLGEVIEAGRRYTFPLHRQRAKNYVKARVALVGDAAHIVHPLAGRGINMGLLDAASLAEVVVSAVNHRRDFSSYASLRRYERWRKADNFSMYAGVDAIKKLFASDMKSVKSLRSMGLQAASRIRWIKNTFARHATGDRGGLPKIAYTRNLLD